MESAELTKDTFDCIQERTAPSTTALIQQTKKKYFLPFVRFLLDWNGSTTQLSPSVPNNSLSNDTSSSSQQNNSSSNYSALSNQDEEEDDDNCFDSGKGVDFYAERANGLTDGNENETEGDSEFNKFEILLPEPNRTGNSTDHHYHLVKNDSTDLTEILFTHFDLFSGVPTNKEKEKEENNYYFHTISFDSVDEDQQDLLKDQKATDKDHSVVRGPFQATELNPFPVLKRDRKRKFAFLESIQEEFENEIYF
jgi:hypothetical protein